MPRVAGIYSRPTGIDAVANNTIDSGKYNSNVADVEADLNLPRPVVAGGTGATNVVDARANLQAEVAFQQITNYDSAVWENGSFFSNPGATGAPPGTGYIHGIFTGNATASTVVAVDVSDGALPHRRFTRERNGGVWSAWSAAAQFSSDVTIQKASPQLALVRPNSSTPATLVSYVTAPSTHQSWAINLGDGTGESGDNFSIGRFANDGSFQGSPFAINRLSGYISLSSNINTDVNILKTTPTIAVIQADNTNPAVITSANQTGAYRQVWAINMGNGVASGNHFQIARYSDAGAFVDLPLDINRATGKTSLKLLAVPQNGLPVSGGAYTGAAIQMAYGPQFGLTCRPQSDGNYPIIFVNAADALVGYITTSATVTSYATSSDERLKEDLQPAVNDAARIIDETLVYNFRWKSTGERSYGVIAQQAVTVYPLAVTHDEVADTFGVDYSKYVPILLQEAKTLRSRIKTLEALIGTSPMATILQRLDVLDKFREKIEAL